MIADQSRRRITAGSWAAPIVDVLTLIVALIGLHELSARLSIPSGRNTLLLVLVYLFFCIGVYLIRKLPTGDARGRWYPPKPVLDPRTRGVFAFLFGLVMMTTVAYQLGYFVSIQSIQSATLDEGSSSSLIVYMPGALLGFSMLYILVLAFPIQESLQIGGKKAAVMSLLGLISINALLMVGAAQVNAILAQMVSGGSALWWLLVLILLALLFVPPRVLYQSKYPLLTNMISSISLLIFITWLAVS